MNSEWETVRVGDVAQVIGGATPATGDDSLWGGDVPWLTPKDLSDRPARYTSAGSRFLTKRGLDSCSANLVPEDTVLLTSRAPIGYVSIAKQALATNQGFKSLSLKPDQYPLFWYYLLRSSKEYLESRANGSTFKEISGSVVKDLQFLVPPFAEQRRIAGVLGALDDLIEVNRGLIRDLQDLALSRYAQLSSQVTESRRLGDLVAVNTAQTKPQASGYLTYLDIASVGDAVVEWPGAMPWSAAPSRARRLAPAGSTIWSTVRPNRRAHALLTHVPEDLVVSTGFAVLEPRAMGAAEIFCATHGEPFVDYLMSRADGSAYPAVRASVFEDAQLPFLGSDASAGFEDFAWPLLHAAGELDMESRQLQATRDQLLPLLMSGRVRVSEGVAA